MTTRSKKVIETNPESNVEETAVMITETPAIDFTAIKDTIDGWSNNAIEDLIDYSQAILTNRKRNEVLELEEQMREIQHKLIVLKGTSVVNNGEKTPKTSRPIINPKDHSQVYKFGKHPKWLQDLVAEQTAKNLTKPTWIIMNELREASKTQ